MHPFEELHHLLGEYKIASEAMDETGAFRIAMHIREAAAGLVIEAAKNMSPILDARKLGLKHGTSTQ